MSLAEIAGAIPRAHHKPRREKMFGEGRLLPLDRNAKARIMVLARALIASDREGEALRRADREVRGRARGAAVGLPQRPERPLLPIYERIAERADCARSTVYEAIRALERAGILTWVNRIARIREWGPDLFGRAQNRWRVIRTSNAYMFVDPQPPARPPDSSKSELPTGTEGQELFPWRASALDAANPPASGARARLEEA